MAKEKRSAASTPEERLTQALVPESEQPYPVPENWCWVSFGHIIELISGRDAAISSCNDKGVGIPYILGASNIDNNHFTVERWIEKPEVISRKGDVLLSVKGTIGKTYVQKEDCINISRQIMALRPKNGLDTQFLYHLLQTICEELRIVGNGLIPGISRSDILDKAVPLAPLTEQQRIVAVIEELFADLDKAQENISAILEKLETRKSILLHKAFTGELTAKWRVENGVRVDSWVKYNYADLGTSKLGKMLDKAKNKGTTTPYLRNINVRWFDFDLSDISTMLANEDEIKALSVKRGDLFICEGGEPGRCAIWKDVDSNLIFQKALHRFRPNDKVISEILCFYLYYLNLNGTLQNYFTGTTIKHLTGQSLAKIEVLLPTLNEQAEIVRVLDAFFEEEKRMKECLQSLQEKIALRKKVILADAFRGRLGTNDPNEQSAVELLKEILNKG